MKLTLKSAVIIGVCLFGLSGCDSLPRIFGGNEVPENVRDESTVIKVPPGAIQQAVQQPYPLLGTVPSKPKDFPSQAEIDQSFRDMEDDRAEGQDIRQQIQDQYPADQALSQP